MLALRPSAAAARDWNREECGVGGRLAGKAALVTAAGQGIGRATAVAMAREGAQVIATDINPQLLQAFAGMAGITTRVLDVLDDAAVKATIDDAPALAILFNCAGFVHNGTILDCDPQDWAFSFDLNVRAMYMTIRCALPKMLERNERSRRRRKHHQHGFSCRVDPGPAEPLCLRRKQGSGHRSDQGRCGGLCRAGGSAVTRSRRAPSTRPRLRAASAPLPIRPKPARLSLHASRWAASPSRRRLHRLWCFSLPMSRRSRREMSTRSMAA